MFRRLLRTSLISLSKARWAQNVVTHWGVAWRAASRFVAGETLDQAIRVVQGLNDRGILATLDALGEHTGTPDEARYATEEVLLMLDGIDAAGVRSNASIKLSQFGLTLDEDLCRANLRRILERAKSLNIFVRIDMEDSTLTDKTLAVLEWAWAEGFSYVGVVSQAYLYRSEADIRHLLAMDGRIRLCKGAYNEPEEVAFPKLSEVDASYDRLSMLLLEATLRANSPQVSVDGRHPPIAAFATHDEARVDFILSESRRLGLPKGAIEFQMLYGIRRDLQESLVKQGYPVRVYVPYGTYWYPYFMRRLAERPENIWFFVKNFFRQ